MRGRLLSRDTKVWNEMSSAFGVCSHGPPKTHGITFRQAQGGFFAAQEVRGGNVPELLSFN